MSLHRDRWNGVEVERPDGWFVENRKGIVTVRRDPCGAVAALVWPLRGPYAASSDALARQFFALARSADPSFQAWCAPRPDAQGALSFRTAGAPLGRRLEGRFRIHAANGHGVIAGIQAPPEELAALAPLLTKVLASVKSIPAIPRSVFRDPAEGAFTFEIPAGFQARGGIVRSPVNGLPMTGFETQDPGGALRASVSPEVMQFSEANPLGALGAMFGGMMGMGGMGMGGMGMPSGAPSMPFRAAHEFARDYLVPRFRPGARVEAAHDRADLAAMAMGAYVARGMAGQVDVSTGVIQIVYDERGAARRERTQVTCARLRMYGQWTACIEGSLSAPVAQWEDAEPILAGTLDSYLESNSWRGAQDAAMNAYLLQQQQERNARLRDVSRTLSQTNDIITQGYNERQQVYDRIAHDGSNAMRGRQDMADGSGQLWNVPAGHEQYWRDGQGNVFGGGWNAQPDPTWQRLDPR